MKFAKVYKNKVSGKWILAICASYSLVHEDVAWMDDPNIGNAPALTPDVDIVDIFVEFDDEAEAMFAMALHYENEVQKLKDFSQKANETAPSGFVSPLSIFHTSRSHIKNKLGHYPISNAT